MQELGSCMDPSEEARSKPSTLKAASNDESLLLGSLVGPCCL